jgi:TonB family protein
MATIPARAGEPARAAGTNDRRLALRRAVVESHLITVDLDFQDGALLLDLSETGMSVQLVVDAPTENTTTFQFELPEKGGRVEGIGRITWTDGSGRLGIQFERIDQMSRLHLAEWLSRDPRDEMTELRRDLATEKLEGDQALAFIVERVRSVTCATGAAIALEDGGEIVCRASSGSAPGVGARVDPNSGLSGECVRTGEIVRCDDTETDARADTLVCRRLDLRSMVIVPVRMQQCPAGVLVAFSSQPQAFESGDAELVLRRAADLVAEIAVRQSEPASPPSSQTALAPAMLETLLAELQAGDEPTPARMAAQPQPKLESATSLGPIISRDGEPPTGSWTGKAALASVAAQRLSPWKMRIAGAGILVAVLVVGGWQRWPWMNDILAMAMKQEVAPSPLIPDEAGLRDLPRAIAPPMATNTPALLLAANTPTAPASSNAAPAPSKPATPPPVPVAAKTVHPPAPVNNAPVEKAAEPITLPPPDITKAERSAPPVAALFAGSATEASLISNLLRAPVAAPKRDTTKVSQMSGGKLIKKVDPIYPSRAMGMHGEVVLKATINREGQVTKIDIVRGPAVLAQAAAAAVQRWSYEPFLLNGEPIEVQSDIVVNFKASGQ